MNKVFHIFVMTVMAMIFSVSAVFAETPDNNKVRIDYYWGIGCHFCEKVKPFIDDVKTKYGDRIDFRDHEVFQNEHNFAVFQQVMSLYKYNPNEIGTPTLIINGTVLTGSGNIEEKLIPAIDDALIHSENRKPSLHDDVDKSVAQAEKVKGQGGNVKNPPILSENVAGGIPKEDSGELSHLTLGAITLAALVDSINPCAMMVLILLMSSLFVYQNGNRKRIIVTAFAFILAVFLTYFFIGFALTHIISAFDISKPIIFAVSGIAILLGILNLKDAFFFRKGGWAIEIPEMWREKLMQVVMKVTSPIGAFFTGMLVTLFELPCTGGPYIFGLSLISSSVDVIERILLLCYYNIIFVFPLIVLACVVIAGSATIEQAEEWRNKHFKLLHGITGVVLIVCGLWVLFFR